MGLGTFLLLFPLTGLVVLGGATPPQNSSPRPPTGPASAKGRSAAPFGGSTASPMDAALTLSEDALIALLASNPRPTDKAGNDTTTTAKDLTPDMIQNANFTAETHYVLTADGFNLTMHRVANPGKRPVFLQHGLLSSSADWVVPGRGRALPFLLHGAGYDVWLGNFRGNTYSRRHVKLTPRDRAFWDFSWNEKGFFDLPAMIDYVLEKTQQSNLVYVGHSEGTTAFFVLASMKTEYNNKVSAFIALAPLMYLSNMNSPILRIIAAGGETPSFLMNTLGLNEFTPSQHLLNYGSNLLCSNVNTLQWACSNPLFLITGFNEDIDQALLAEIVKNIPAGTSTKTLVHYTQLIKSDRFRHFDYGFVRNFLIYRKLKPPEYPVSKITTPVHIHFGSTDILATPEDVQRVNDRLTTVKKLRRVPLDSFNHFDFLWSKDAKDFLYDELLDDIMEITGGERGEKSRARTEPTPPNSTSTAQP